MKKFMFFTLVCIIVMHSSVFGQFLHSYRDDESTGFRYFHSLVNPGIVINLTAYTKEKEGIRLNSAGGSLDYRGSFNEVFGYCGGMSIWKHANVLNLNSKNEHVRDNTWTDFKLGATIRTDDDYGSGLFFGVAGGCELLSGDNLYRNYFVNSQFIGVLNKNFTAKASANWPSTYGRMLGSSTVEMEALCHIPASNFALGFAGANNQGVGIALSYISSWWKHNQNEFAIALDVKILGNTLNGNVTPAAAIGLIISTGDLNGR